VSGLWEVTRVYTPWHGGIEHACIKSIAGGLETMTLATSVIADKRRFVPENWNDANSVHAGLR
jgi:hypothetical protein